MSFGQTESTCRTCGGSGSVIVKDAKGQESKHQCPACKGSGKSTGVVKK